MTKSTKQVQIPTKRKKKLPEYRTFRLSAKIKADTIKVLPSSKALWKDTWAFLWRHKYKMLGFVFIYVFFYALLVKGFSGLNTNMEWAKDELIDAVDGNIEAVIMFVSLYISLLSSLTSTTDDISNFYQFAIVTIFSLAFIWLIRKLHGRSNPDATVKNAFYLGMGPLIPFLGVVAILALELIPAGMGSLLMTTGLSTAVVSTSAETTALGIVMILTLVLTIYLLAGSVFALYIVTLPGTSPMVAVRSSMRLLRIHRWQVLFKILWFFFVLILLGFVLVLPFIIWLPHFAEIAFFVMGCASFGVLHTYLYKLYRSLL